MCVCRFCSTFPGSLLSVLQRPNVCAMRIDAGDALFSPATQAHSLEHGGSPANSFPEEAQRKVREYCPHHLPDSTTRSIKFNENRRGKAAACVRIMPPSQSGSQRKLCPLIVL